MDSSETKDPKFTQHSSQIRRAEVLLEKIKADRVRSNYLSRAFWYVCFFSSLIGSVAGFSVATTNFAGTKLDNYLSAVLGLITMIYPLTRCMDLEGRRHRHNIMALFCTDLELKVETSLDSMKDAMKNVNAPNFNSQEHNKFFESMIEFIDSTTKTIEKLEIGDDDFQRTLKDFQQIERGLKKD